MRLYTLEPLPLLRDSPQVLTREDDLLRGNWPIAVGEEKAETAFGEPSSDRPDRGADWTPERAADRGARLRACEVGALLRELLARALPCQ